MTKTPTLTPTSAPSTAAKSRRVHVVNMPKGTRWPNIHEWALAIFSFLTWKILRMIEVNPNLLAVPSFMQFTQTLATGGILACAAWLWSSNKAKDTKDEEQSNQAVGDLNVDAQGDVNVKGGNS